MGFDLVLWLWKLKDSGELMKGSLRGCFDDCRGSFFGGFFGDLIWFEGWLW